VTLNSGMPPTSQQYIERLMALRSPAQQARYERSFKPDKGEVFIGVRMGDVFRLSKEFVDLPLGEIEKLLDSPVHEVRAGGVKIMAYQASGAKTPDGVRRELCQLYLRRHDRINDWDLVDLGAWDVVGRYLFDQPRDVLNDLARSKNWWERRTAVLATLFFIRRDDLDDSFRLAGVLVDDEHDLVLKAVGGVLREAGKRDRPRLIAFLDKHAATMPRVALRYAIEHLDPEQRAQYLGLRKAEQQG